MMSFWSLGNIKLKKDKLIHQVLCNFPSTRSQEFWIRSLFFNFSISRIRGEKKPSLEDIALAYLKLIILYYCNLQGDTGSLAQFIEYIFWIPITRGKFLILGTRLGSSLAYSDRFMRDLHSWDCILLLNPTPRNWPARRHFLSYGARRYSIFPNGTFIVAVRRSYSSPFIPPKALASPAIMILWG